MGSNLNFRNFGSDMSGEMGGGGRLSGDLNLARQPSIYSLTFDEFLSTVGGIEKDFGSMNMDELLKNIWSAEENQNIGLTSSCAGGGGGSGGGQGGNGYLQRQGSLTLPRTVSQKTVDEVWRDISKDFGGAKDATGGVSGFDMPKKQQTLGEITLEEFLARAGAMMQESPLSANPNNACFSVDFSCNVNSLGLGQQQARGTSELMGSRIAENSNQIALQSANLPLNVNGVRSAAQQLAQPQHSQQITPKPAELAYGASIEIPTSGQFGSPGIRGGVVGASDPTMNKTMVQNTILQSRGLGMDGLGASVTAATGSPAASSEDLTKKGDTSSVSPVPNLFNGGLQGKRSAALDKVVERRQKRMIKNRESAARSRARKQAHTTELEAEVAKLKEENELLRKKQAQMVEMQKNQFLEMMDQQHGGSKKRCLRRTQTSPW